MRSETKRTLRICESEEFYLLCVVRTLIMKQRFVRKLTHYILETVLKSTIKRRPCLSPKLQNNIYCQFGDYSKICCLSPTIIHNTEEKKHPILIGAFLVQWRLNVLSDASKLK